MTVRVKLSVEHLREDITQYLADDAAEKAPVIAEAVKAAVDAFDFDTATEAICKSELEKFVKDVAGVYFRELLKSPEAHAVVLETLRKQMGEGS